MPPAISTIRTRNAAKSQAASKASAPLIPAPRAGPRQDPSPAALSRAREYFTSADSSSPPGPPSLSAASSSDWTVARSTWLPSVASRARIETRSSCTDRKPLSTAARTVESWPPSAFSGSRISTTLPGTRMPSTEGWEPIIPMSPSRVLAMTMRAFPDHSSPSGTTSATCRVTGVLRFRRPRSPVLDLLGLLLHVLDTAAHEEGLLRIVVVLALVDRLERGDGLLQWHEHARL